MTPSSDRLARGLCLALGFVTLVCFWPITRHEFVNVDDVQYIVENPRVAAGLTWSGALWAFRTGYACNWHPVTWLSHMADGTLYGLNPGGHHFTSVLFHSANAMLLFLLLRRTTGATWRSAFVAALFAWHPLRVESVAWAAERKDVLSAFFGLLALLAYVRYAHARDSRARAGDEGSMAGRATNPADRDSLSGSRPWYLLALLMFGLALLSKPMLVTLPGLMLLLDFWPLRRWTPSLEGSGGTKREETRLGFKMSTPSLGALLREKIAFGVLALCASVVTFVAQQNGGAVSSVSGIPISLRISNALVSYLRYVGKILWPADLSPVYPYPSHWPILSVVVACVFLIAASVFVVSRAKRSPALVTGWFWFVAALVPVIGLVQVGPQALADRYTYLPSIGFYIVLVWGLTEALQRLERGGSVVTGLGVAALAGCLAVTQFQLKHWLNGLTLYSHAVSVTKDNYVAYDYLATALHLRGYVQEARAALRESLRLQPRYAEGRYNLGIIELEQGHLDEAVLNLGMAAELSPRDGNAQHGLGNALLKQGRLAEAEARLAEAVRLKPDDPHAANALGTALLRLSKWPEAAAAFAQAARLRPGWAEAHRNLGVALIQQGRWPEAIEQFVEAVRLDPADPELRFNLGLALSEHDRPAEAAVHFTEGLRLRPDDTKTHYRLAAVLVRLQQSKPAVRHYREALRLTPEFPEARAELAWLLATAAEEDLRDGVSAVQLAEQACAATENPRAGFLTTLAAAYAEAGRFSESVATAEKALEVALTYGPKEALAKAETVLKSCAANEPIRQ